jgi:hypothetical protein
MIILNSQDIILKFNFKKNIFNLKNMMMNKINTLISLICILFLGTSTTILAQTNTVACKATCLGTAGSVKASGPPQTSPNQWLPCDGGTTEDNPLWWAFTVSPGVTSVSFNVTASNCTNNSGIQASIWTGDDCAALSFIGTCITGFEGIATANVEPCKTYLLQIDGIAGDRCAISFTYTPSQILTKWDAPIIDGPEQICLGSSAEYTATVNGCAPPEMTWTTTPTAAVSSTSTKAPPLPAHKVKVTFNNPGTYQVCAKGKSRCAPTGTIGCKTVYVFDLPDVNDSLKLCFDQLPYNYCNIQLKTNEAMLAAAVQYGISPNIISTATPSCLKITAPAGVVTKTIPYSVTPSGCKGKINLKLDITPTVSKNLGNFYFCDKDSIVVCGKSYKMTSKDSTYKLKCSGPAAVMCSDTTVIFTIKGKGWSFPNPTFSMSNQAAQVGKVSALYKIVTAPSNLSTTWSIEPQTAGKIIAAYKDSVRIEWLNPGSQLICATLSNKCDSKKFCFPVKILGLNNEPQGTVTYSKCSKKKPYTYTAKFNLTGGTPPYFVNGKQLVVPVYLRLYVPSGQAFTQTFKDSNGQSFTVTGFKVCDGTNLQIQDKDIEIQEELTESSPNIEFLDNKIVNQNEDWRIENVTIFNLQGQRLCSFEMTENLDLQACMSQYPSSIYIIKTLMVSEKGDKQTIVKKMLRL